MISTTVLILVGGSTVTWFFNRKLPLSGVLPFNSSIDSVPDIPGGNGQASSSPKTFLPNDFQGKQVIVEQEHPVDEELQAIWENLQNLENREIDGVSITENGGSLYSLTATGNGISLSSPTWRINAKRNALTKVALALIRLCQSDDEAKTSFLSGEVKALTFDDAKKLVKVTFTAKCSM